MWIAGQGPYSAAWLVTGARGQALTGPATIVGGARWCGAEEGSLAALAAAQPSKAACLVQAGLLPLGAEEPPVSQVAQDPGALHRGLETPEQPFAVFTVTERHKCQLSLLGPMRRQGASTGQHIIA